VAAVRVVEPPSATETSPAAGSPPPRAGTFSPGAKIGHYEVIGELGRGGMGQVFVARDTRLARRVALKFLRRTAGEDVTRFLAEARATARCTHENIVVIHDVGEHDGVPYMVLEYLDGATLRPVLAAGRVSTGRAIELALPIARAVARAHEFGIVHRDLKPENVFVTASGAIKVLDFGIAKLLHPDPAVELDKRGVTSGTLPYMSPEQFGIDAIDHRTDLWAIGIMLYELLVGRHPYAPVTLATLFAYLGELDRPVPAIPDELDVPNALRRVVARCLAKRKSERYASAAELCRDLEALLPGRTGRRLGDDESPYPGLSAFQEADADRFFGRSDEIARVVQRLREQPLVGVIGASGVGKSSLLRAGVIPWLKASRERWDAIVVRPGRAPLASLAALVDLFDGERDVRERLAREPGLLGAALRARAAADGSRVLLFVDQFEELYTLGADEAQRRAFAACLCGVADDANGPLRVAVAMRSDFLDRVGEASRFLDELARSLVFVQPMGEPGLRDALVRPLEPLGYAFESTEIVERMVGELATTSGALPLLQFAASRLWEARDRERKLLTRAGHAAMGGIAGALAGHADNVLAALAPPARRLARAVFQRLVTPERTRAIVDRDELRGLAADRAMSDALVDQLVAARLLVVQAVGDGAGSTVELVHESLIGGWPTLRRWLDESQEDAAYLAQIRTAARQWDQKARAHGLVWRGDAAREALQFRARYRGELSEREGAFLDAVVKLGSRSARIRRALVLGGFALMLAIAVGSAIAFVRIRDAGEAAEAQAVRAEDEKAHAKDETARAQQEAERARAAEARVTTQLDEIRTAQAARDRAESDSRASLEQAQMSREQLQLALAKARRDQAAAEDASRKAREAEQRAEELLERETERARNAEKWARKITNTLP
jgi:hypothetical protein